MKKALSLTLVLVLVLALAVPAFADESVGFDPAELENQEAGIMAISDTAMTNGFPDDGTTLGEIGPVEVVGPVFDTTGQQEEGIMLHSGGYACAITVDGVEVDVSGIPAAPADYLPMRAICETVGAYVDWYPEDNEGFFQFDGNSIVVSFADLSVKVDFEDTGVPAYLDPAGFTFLPVSVLEGLETVSVEKVDGDTVAYAITTSASDPLVKLGNDISEACELPMLQPMPLDSMVSFYGFEAENYEALMAMIPMMNVKASAVIIAKPAEGKMDGVKADLKGYQDTVIQNFEHYLADQYAVAKAGQIIESPDGAYVLLLIAETPDAGVALFNEAFAQ